jgi:hypothetical protein
LADASVRRTNFFLISFRLLFIVNFQHLDENTFPGEKRERLVCLLLSHRWLIFALRFHHLRRFH